MGKYIFMPENCNHSSRQYEQEGLRLNKISCNDCGVVLWQRNQQSVHPTPLTLFGMRVEIANWLKPGQWFIRPSRRG